MEITPDWYKVAMGLSQRLAASMLEVEALKVYVEDMNSKEKKPDLTPDPL